MTTSAVTTFGVFKSLLTNSINNDASLSAAVKSSMLARVNELPREVSLLQDFSNVDSTGGLVTVNNLTKSIEVAVGATGTNRVEWEMATFAVPTRISGTLSSSGFLPGHGGASPNALTALADIALQYRFSSTDAWKAFNRNTVLEGVTQIQFSAAIADQVGATALPGIVLVAQQE